MLIAAIIASFVLGAALTASVLGKRWKSAVNEAKQELEGMAEPIGERSARVAGHRPGVVGAILDAATQLRCVSGLHGGQFHQTT